MAKRGSQRPSGRPSTSKGRSSASQGRSVSNEQRPAGKRPGGKLAGKATSYKGSAKPAAGKSYGVAKNRPEKRRRPPVKTAVNLPPRQPGERLQKLLASAGVASRRECEVLILEGRVEVDGEVVTELGVRVDPFKQSISFDGEALTKSRRVYFAVNKPEGVVCTARDPSGRQRVTDLLPPSAGRVFNVGRLDMASEGLILLTNDGELANKLTHPRHGVEKIYHVQVQGVPSAETLSQLRRGIYLAEGKAHFVNARVKSKRKSGAILEIVLDEGRNREIRRVLARVGHKVQRLTRIAVGPVRLGDLPSGAYRPLTSEEIKSLRKAPDSKRDKEKEEKKNSPQQGYRASSNRPKKGQGSRSGQSSGAGQASGVSQGRAGRSQAGQGKTNPRSTTASTTDRKPAGRVILGLDGTGDKKKDSKKPAARKPRKRS